MLLLAIFLFQPNVVARQAERRVPDHALENRLEVVNVYRAKHGDTLKKAANLLYGHRTWWTRLVKLNPQLKSHDPDKALPPGAQLRYEAPKIGNTYVVQRNDCLIRIAQWKYGSMDRWPELYRKNATRIENPNLIHPGDQLMLGENGQVLNAKTGQEVMASVSPTTVPPAPREPASRPAPPESFFDSKAFYYGFGAGVLVLLYTPLMWIYRRIGFHLGSSSLSFDYSEPETKLPAQPLPAQEPEMPEIPQLPSHFRRGPIEDPRVDKSLIPDLDIDLDRRPNYFSLIKKPLWKYMSLLKKK